ncbi:MaoC family dehydratase [Sodalis-like endosymbiont of Proechinophthirus fluctus]|uniref:MaoC family dehydratase n=1 Tax=Sodalis-like endosymbiont of Proechinophthirus fluctus TaxID=1462730 RepID=UPI001FCB7A69|nr:MaoC family dehydratase [Sodalis-like endosymbiont of Proechinophthirus fluctus]
MQPGNRYDSQGDNPHGVAHIIEFAGITGDLFAVHIDDSFARQQGFFSGRIAYGLLGLMLVDGLKTRSAVRGIATLG